MHRRLGLLLFCLCTVLAGFRLSQQPGEPAPVEQRCDACEHRLNGSYYDVAEYQTALLINNKSPDAVLVEARVFDLGGRAADLPAFEVPGNDFMLADLKESLQGLPGRFKRGSIELRYFGNFLQVGAQLRLSDPRSRMGFEEQLVRVEEFSSSSLRSNWWLPDSKARMLWILCNTSESTLTAEGKADGLRNLARLKGLVLRARETALIEAVPSGLAGRIDLSHDGKPGDLIMRAIVLEPKSGYSSVIEAADPARAKTSELHGAGLRLGAGLRPVISLANHGEEASDASIRLTLSVGGGVRQAALADVSLRPGGVETVEGSAFKAALADAGLPEATMAGVEVRYSAAPGSVTGYAGSVSDDQDIAYRVPLLDAKAHFSSAGIYPWDLREGQNTIFYVKNLTSRPQRHHYYLTHEKEVVYFSGYASLQPGESMAVDVAQLRSRQEIDKHGRLVPLHADNGQIHWSVLGAGVLLDARVEQVDLARGTAVSYFCAECCNNTVHTELFPSAINGIVGDPPITFLAQQTTEDCEGNMGPTEDVQVSHIWFDDPDIISVEGEDTVFCVGPGSTSLTAFVPIGSGGGEANPACSEEPMGAEEQIPVPVEVVAPTLSCPSSVTRGQQITCSISNVGTNTISNWRFESSVGNVNRSSGQSSTTWSGTMVQGGTVKVTVGSQILSANVSVSARNSFEFMAVEAEKKNNGFNASLTVPNPPTSTDPRTSFYVLTLAFNFFTNTVSGGPNDGFKFVTSVSNANAQGSTTYHWVISQAVESTTSEFYGNQCGDYHPQTNPSGFISGAQLKANSIHHESANLPNSHYYQYKTAQDNSANNIGLVAESQVGAPSKSIMQFTTEVENILNTKVVAILNATGVEPCQGSTARDGSNGCIFNGFLNFPPYEPCN